ncbi:MAG: SGNH/GDSL hydrolase family protein [Flavobacteriaceae bacterium]|nr:SGNH/GDSL hydrolase family protein [Bacteroidia bacterium]NNF76234.1 SGNH/GDSL hydrolase family protein [Flavobacteriaceae bacterium]NNK73432.1 SGNH/GDSL hydrolase family protein [Flavobacteriaceae bacterium]
MPENEDSGTDSSTSNPDADYQLLFIGNSLTLYNDLPDLVEERAGNIGISVGVTTNAFPGYGLEDHWNAGLIQGLINSGYYDYVIIQQGPSSQSYGRTSLISFGQLIKELCDLSDTQLAYFMVWPAIENFNTFPGVIQNYSDAAQQNNAILSAVGSHWKAYIENTEDYSYYSSDGFHPSLLGSRMSAQIIVQSLGIQ